MVVVAHQILLKLHVPELEDAAAGDNRALHIVLVGLQRAMSQLALLAVGRRGGLHHGTFVLHELGRTRVLHGSQPLDCERRALPVRVLLDSHLPRVFYVLFR